MLFRLKQFVVAGANLYLFFLLFRLVTGTLGWGLGVECLALSGFWLLLTTFSAPSLFGRYYDVMARVRFWLPLIIGLALSAVACWAGGLRPDWSFGTGSNFHLLVGIAAIAGSSVAMCALGVGELACWGLLAVFYQDNGRRQYINTNRGRVPVEIWLTPDPAILPFILKPGDLILTSGMFGPAGHGEVVFRDRDGTLKLLSTWMGHGVVINDLVSNLERVRSHNHHYIVLRLVRGFTPEQEARAIDIAYEMLACNRAWGLKRQAQLKARLRWVPISDARKEKLVAKFGDGYDWRGLLIGRRTPDHWTCIAACMEFYSRLGVKMYPYGTGLLGLGTGLLDPINPSRFLQDPHFQVLNKQDEESWAKDKSLTPIRQPRGVAC